MELVMPIGPLLVIAAIVLIIIGVPVVLYGRAKKGRQPH